MTYQWLSIETETPIVELRRERLAPDRRDGVLARFEAELIEAQEAAGTRVLGSFTLPDDPQGLVWLRGFVAMPARRQALERLAGLPAWQAAVRDGLGGEAQLLRAIVPSGGLVGGSRRPSLGEHRPSQPYVVVLSDLRHPDWIGNYHLWLRLFLRKAGADPFASFATLPAENDFPALPVCRNRTMHVALLRTATPPPPLPAELRNMLRGAPDVLRLEPTPRSLLR